MGFSVYKKDNGMYGIDRTLHGVYVCAMRGQWVTKEAAIKRVHLLADTN